MLLPRLVESIRSKKTINLEGESGIRINPIHVNDAAEALIASLKANGNKTFNIAVEELSLFEICEIMSRHMGIPACYHRTNSPPNDLIADISAMKSQLITPRFYFKRELRTLYSENENFALPKYCRR